MSNGGGQLTVEVLQTLHDELNRPILERADDGALHVYLPKTKEGFRIAPLCQICFRCHDGDCNRRSGVDRRSAEQKTPDSRLFRGGMGVKRAPRDRRRCQE